MSGSSLLEVHDIRGVVAGRADREQNGRAELLTGRFFRRAQLYWTAKEIAGRCRCDTVWIAVGHGD